MTLFSDFFKTIKSANISLVNPELVIATSFSSQKKTKG